MPSVALVAGSGFHFDLSIADVNGTPVVADEQGV